MQQQDRASAGRYANGGHGNLRQIFPGDGRIYAVTDDEWVGIAAGYYGLEHVPLAEVETIPPGANVVLFLRHSLVSVKLRRMFREFRVLTVPIASFDASLEAALYTQKLTMATDYATACQNSRYWIENLQEQAGRLVFHDGALDEGGDEPGRAGTANRKPGQQRTHIVCSLADSMSIDALPEPAIDVGQWVGVGSYCELALNNRPLSGRPSPFTIEGTVVAAGALVARHPRFTQQGDARIRAAERLRAELVERAPLVLRMEANVLTSLQAGGKDFTEALREVTNPELGLQAMELGIGTNQAVLPQVNWKVNSQLNEGAGPLHIGFGEGITGAHMDFVVAQSTHIFQPAG
ncbi:MULTISPECIES: hypothetical protein [Actinomadura]|uniref:Crocagin biosynthetic protein CgnE/B domain-containing protein n=1 Tax=Actinomadura madurae TaxID=1993 RepID=A0A1I5IDR7_9ACTN|nr:hypothetical protein [Actinomadura madurae]SFO58489.1 hypothetical protein SAMN04489713_107273 [Actinomadura madurae]